MSFNFNSSISLSCAAMTAAFTYLASSGENTNPSTKIVVTTISAIATYALSHCLFKAKSSDQSAKFKTSNPQFRQAFNQAYKRLEDEDLVDPQIKGEKRSDLLQIVEEGMCFGQAHTFLKEWHEKPLQEPLEIVSTLNLDEIIYLQLRNHLYNFEQTLLGNEENRFTNPYKIRDFDLPWLKKVNVIHSSGIEMEDSWIKTFGSIIEEGSLNGRVSFSTHSKGGHTFAFWSRPQQQGYFDGGKVYAFKNVITFCKEVRKTILQYRKYYGQTDSEKEMVKYRLKLGQDESQCTDYFPVIIFQNKV